MTRSSPSEHYLFIMGIRKDIKDEYQYSVNNSNVHGKGIFAKNNIKKGKKSLALIFDDGDFLYADLGRYINHSKSPNSRLVDGGNNDFFVITLKDIGDGDEMLIDYDENPNGFQRGNNLDQDYFGLFELDEIDDERIKYRFYTKLNENLRRIKQLLIL